MMAPPPGQERPFEQINNGPGTFIGRDNYGPIEMVDAKTKAVLEKLSKEAPKLGKLLSKALHEGLISPETALLLGYVVRSINEDVAGVLLTASRNINEDVANLLHEASQTIDETTVSELKQVGEDIKQNLEKNQEVASQISVASGTLEKLVDRLHEAVGEVDGSAKPRGQMSTSPPSVATVNRRGRSRVQCFFWGVAVSAIAFFVLAVNYHWSFR